MLVVFGGLPGSGKTSIARRIADELAATFLRIDSIEVAIQRWGVDISNSPVAYSVGNAVAADQLRGGRSVVVDAVNPIAAARAGWTELADGFEVPCRLVQVTCSDPVEHRRRVETRVPDIPGHVVPTWAEVLALAYEPWIEPHLSVDNVGDLEPHVAAVRRWLRDG
jgi:predicted kinase